MTRYCMYDERRLENDKCPECNRDYTGFIIVAEPQKYYVLFGSQDK